MTLFRTLLTPVFCIALSAGAAAETKLTDFNGEWTGTGQDRDGPLQSLQDTRCQNTIRARQDRLRTDMVCERRSGVRKSVRMTVTLQGDQFSGTIAQRTTQPGQNEAVISGNVTGKKTDKSATLQVRWSDATPNATIELKLHNPASFAMKVTALSMSFMDLTFNKTADRGPPRQPRQPTQ